VGIEAKGKYQGFIVNSRRSPAGIFRDDCMRVVLLSRTINELQREGGDGKTEG